jgi:hypothetical protein
MRYVAVRPDVAPRRSESKRQPCAVGTRARERYERRGRLDSSTLATSRTSSAGSAGFEM